MAVIAMINGKGLNKNSSQFVSDPSDEAILIFLNCHQFAIYSPSQPFLNWLSFFCLGCTFFILFVFSAITDTLDYL